MYYSLLYVLLFIFVFMTWIYVEIYKEMIARNYPHFPERKYVNKRIFFYFVT